MKKHTWDNPNKMHFESAYKTFNEQTNLISTGNVIANTQFSSYIRPYNETECNGLTRPAGELLKFDLQYFRNIPERIINILWDKTRTESYILYQFSVYNKKYNERDIIGYVLTDYNDNLITYAVTCNYGSCYYKRESAILECIEYITNKAA